MILVSFRFGGTDRSSVINSSATTRGLLDGEATPSACTVFEEVFAVAFGVLAPAMTQVSRTNPECDDCLQSTFAVPSMALCGLLSDATGAQIIDLGDAHDDNKIA
jgi:hypothetical protein